MYRVLYRKYRPRFFADVIGQPQVTDTLKNELIAGRIAHAYLFTGSRGTGKTTCSKILAKAVNCLDPQNGDPCGKCEACLGIDNGSIMDVVEIDAASNNGVDDIRALRDETVFAPADVKYRVYIIDEVHMLSMGAFNALLKTLEEPPPHVIFILATTELHKLPATILSRCQRFDFHRIAPADIAKRLTLVCESEGVHIDENAALLLAGIADGAMRDALSLLDQCMGRSDSITEEVVRNTAGLADKGHLIALTDTFISKDAGAAIGIIDELYSQSKDMARLCDELISHYRGMMLMKTMKKPRDILVMSDDDYNKTDKQSQAMPLAEIISGIETLRTAYENMQRGANRRVEMEMTAVKLCEQLTSTGAGIDPSFEKRLAALENTMKSSARPAQTEASPAAKASAPPKTAGTEGRIGLLELGMREDIGDGAPHPFLKPDRGLESRHRPLELAVVEQDRPRLVADEPAPEIVRARLVQELRGNVVRFQLHPEDVGDGLIDLVPGQSLVRSDLEGVSERVGIAHQADEPLREITVVRQGPLGRAVAVDDDGLAVQHPPEHLPGTVVAVHAEGHGTLVIGVAGPDDRHRKTLHAVLLHQEILARDLVPGILPVGVRERRPLRDERTRRRFLVGRCTADVHVLLRAALEEPPVALHLRRDKADEVAHAVPLRTRKHRPDGHLVVDVGLQDADILREALIPVSPVQERKVPLPFRGQLPRDGGADRAGTADE